MPRLNLIVEGPSEETFVRQVLAPYLGERGVFASARSVETSRSRARILRGGLSNYSQVKKDVVRWLKQDPTAHVSTMFDLYGLPGDFPGSDEARGLTSTARVQRLEGAFGADINDVRFIPYIQLHEFEGLLFSDVAELIDEPQDTHLLDLRRIREGFESPEQIDDGYQTCPSRRICSLFPRYQKVTDGIRIAERIGVAEIRSHCPHFDSWINGLVRLAAPQSGQSD
jgi:hypothetical protein